MLFQYEGTGSLFSLGRIDSVQRAVYSYSQFGSINTYDELDYGSITNSHDGFEDYGEITAYIEQPYQKEDFGTVTFDTAVIPMGGFKPVGKAVVRTEVLAVGGINFTLYGRAETSVIFAEMNKFLDFQGLAIQRITLPMTGQGVLPAVESEGQEAREVSPPCSTLHLSFSGKAEAEVIFNQVPRVFDFVGEAEETASFSWTQAADSDIADGFRSDDYGALTEPVLRTEDFGDITDLNDIPAWHPAIDNYGVITEDETVKAYGQGFFKGGASRMSFSPAPHVHNQLEGFNASPPKFPRLLGTGKDYQIPTHYGEGFLRPMGNPRVQIRMHYFADGGADEYPTRLRGGKLFGFGDGAESTLVLNQGGGFSKFGGASPYARTGFVVGESKQDILVQGGADYLVKFNPEQRMFKVISTVELARAWHYSIDSILNVVGIDFGFIDETPVGLDDRGHIHGGTEYAWEIETYGTLDPKDVKTPMGLFRVKSDVTSSTPRVRAYTSEAPGSAGHIDRIIGTAKIFVLPIHIGQGEFNVKGASPYAQSPANEGTGSVFSFSSTAEAVAFVPAKKDNLFTFESNTTEAAGWEHETTGTLFGFSSTTNAYSATEETPDPLFRTSGEATAVAAFAHNGSGYLPSVGGAAERTTAAYNESSFTTGVRWSEDWGLISEPPYSSSTPATINQYANVPISTYANSIASTFGTTPLTEDYGDLHVDSENDIRTHDRGTLFPDVPVLPFGKFEFTSGTTDVQSPAITGEGSLYSFVGSGEARTNILSGDGLFKFESDFKESTTPAPHIGSGSLYSVVGGAEAYVVLNEGRGLFDVSGTAFPQTVSYAHKTTGRLFGYTGSANAYSAQTSSKGIFRIQGTGGEAIAPTAHIGSGVLFKYVGTTVATVQVEVGGTLFSYSGGFTDLKIGYGWETIEKTHLLVRGNAGLFVLPKHIGAGTFNLLSDTREAYARSPYIAQGRLFGFGDAAECTSVEAEGRTLFSFKGAIPTPLLTFSEQRFVSARFTPDEATTIFKLRASGSGVAYLQRGTGDEAWSPFIPPGSGSIFGFANGAESTKVEAGGKTLFSFEGASQDSKVANNIGSGHLHSIIGAAESYTASIFDTALFRILGSGSEATERPVVGFGRLPSAGGAAESIFINALTEGTLFSFEGNAGERETNAFKGSGSTSFVRNPVGDATQKVTRDFVGSGSLPATGGSAEVAAFVGAANGLFNIDGTSDLSRTKSFVGSGSIPAPGGSSESVSNVEVSFVLFDIGGAGKISLAPAWDGVGEVRVGLSNDGIPGDGSRGITVFKLRVLPGRGLNGATYGFTGALQESFTPAPHVVEGELNVNTPADSGGDESEYIEFERGQPTRIVVI